MDYRLASTISKYYIVIAVVAIAIVGVGGFWLYQSTRPQYESVAEERTVYSYTGNFEHQAEVTRSNSLWPLGEVLENRGTYFLSVTPSLETKFIFSLEDIEHAEGTLDVTSQLRVYSVGGKEIFWMESSDLVEDSWELSKGTFTLDLPEVDMDMVKDRVEEIQIDLKYIIGSVKTEIAVNVLINGTIDGRRVVKEETYNMPITLIRSTYKVGNDLSRTESISETIRTDVKKGSSISAALLPVMMMVVPMLGLGYVSLERRRLNGSELRRLRTEHERSKYDEWVSDGRMPDARFDTEIGMKSLEDLVDASVDMDRRIIYDEEKSIYFFIVDGVLYSYRSE